MPTFEIFAEHSGRIHRWENFDNYLLDEESPTRWRLTYDTDEEGAVEPDREPAEITFTLAGGKITKVSYFDGDDNLLAEIRGLSFDAGLARAFMHPDVDNGRDVFAMMLAPGTTFIGGITHDDWDNYDDITTGIGNDRITARDGHDYIKDAGGADTYDGGAGQDSVSYDEWFWEAPHRVERGILADLAKGRVTGPDGFVDRLKGIEQVRGTFLDDTFKGSRRDDGFMGMQGDDVINGKGGRDYAAFWSDTNQGGAGAVTVDLGRGFARDGWGGRDRLISIEDVFGSHGNDTLIDSGRDNYINANDGDDRITLSGGNDDTEGGNGADRFIFKGAAFGEDGIRDFDGADGDRIAIEGAGNAGDLTITQEDGDTLIRLNDDSVVRLDDYTGPVTPFLLF